MPEPEQDAFIETDARTLTRAGIRSQQHAQRHLNRLSRRVGKQFRVDGDDIIGDIECQAKVAMGISLREQELSEAIQERLTLLAHKFRDQSISREELFDLINSIGEEYGYSYGVPVPLFHNESGVDENHPLELARGVPMRGIFDINQGITEEQQRLRSRHVPVRNSWRVLGDETVSVVDTTEGPMWLKHPHAGNRLRKLMDTAMVRSESMVTAAAELRAMDSLKTRISARQWESYVLSGCFPERSARSDIHYIFRKGYPALALSWHGRYAGNGKVLAALCLHPMGYYQYTFAGLMTPTDEVIAQLLLMRADERKFWAKSGQWHAGDTRSGI